MDVTWETQGHRATFAAFEHEGKVWVELDGDIIGDDGGSEPVQWAICSVEIAEQIIRALQAAIVTVRTPSIPA